MKHKTVGVSKQLRQQLRKEFNRLAKDPNIKDFRKQPKVIEITQKYAELKRELEVSKNA